jgi:MFS family permease
VAAGITVADSRCGRGHPRIFHGWRIVAAFAVTQTVGYGVLYYAFAVLLQPMARTLHASTTVVTGAFTCSVLAGAVMAVPVGRWLDRHGGRALMTVGSIVATGLVVAWSHIHQVWQLYTVLIASGLVGETVLYGPAFAVVVAWFDPARRGKALLAVTAVAGFASAVFLPLTGILTAHYGWRDALLILATIYAALTVPLHSLVVRKPPHPFTTTGRRAGGKRPALVRAALRDKRFWAMAVAFVCHRAAMTTMTIHLVGFLISKGHPATFAATVAGLLGVLSVTGRLTLTGAQRHIRTTTVVAAVYCCQAVAALCLPLVAGNDVGAVAGVIAFGLGFGISSLAAPALLADRYGTTAYATIAGTLSVPVTLAGACAPLAAAALHAAEGYPLVFLAVGTGCLIAAAGITTGTTIPFRAPGTTAARVG